MKSELPNASAASSPRSTATESVTRRRWSAAT
jgi:hypothetical protein